MVAPRRFWSGSCESTLGPSELVVEVQQSDVAALALEMTLLREGLSGGLKVQSRSGPSVVLTQAAQPRVSKAVVTAATDGSFRFTLGTNQVDFVQAVLLRAYRDQMADVNHIHVEGELDGNAFDLTLMFAVSRPPMSAEEAAKLMAD